MTGTITQIDFALVSKTVIQLITYLFFVFIPIWLALNYVTSKTVADLQARIGPRLIGPAGVGFEFAEWIKLLQKQSKSKSSYTETFWLLILMFVLFSNLAVVPLNSDFGLDGSTIVIFFPVWGVLVLVLAMSYLGEKKSGVVEYLESKRVAARCITGILPALLCLLSLGVHFGHMGWKEIAAQQGFSPLSWTIFHSFPLHLIGASVFLMSGIVIQGIYPLKSFFESSDDLLLRSDGFTGVDIIVFRFCRFFAFFMWCTVAIVLYAGGWSLPDFLVGMLSQANLQQLQIVLETIVLLTKVVVLMLMLNWFAATQPRMRTNQLTDFSWKVLSPIAIGVLLVSIVLKGARWLI